jgi:hypothetical protein
MGPISASLLVSDRRRLARADAPLTRPPVGRWNNVSAGSSAQLSRGGMSSDASVPLADPRAPLPPACGRPVAESVPCGALTRGGRPGRRRRPASSGRSPAQGVAGGTRQACPRRPGGHGALWPRAVHREHGHHGGPDDAGPEGEVPGRASFRTNVSIAWAAGR